MKALSTVNHFRSILFKNNQKQSQMIMRNFLSTTIAYHYTLNKALFEQKKRLPFSSPLTITHFVLLHPSRCTPYPTLKHDKSHHGKK